MTQLRLVSLLPRRQPSLHARTRTSASRKHIFYVATAFLETGNKVTFHGERSQQRRSRCYRANVNNAAGQASHRAHQLVMSRKKTHPAGLSWKPRSLWNSEIKMSLSVVPMQLNFCMSSWSRSRSRSMLSIARSPRQSRWAFASNLLRGLNLS